jgi:hypothetical protein
MLNRFRRLPAWVQIALVFAVPVVVTGIYFRFTDLFDVFCRNPDELAEMMPGLRLHALPFFNLRDPIRFNFFQSLFYSQHGLGDVSFHYLSSGLLSILGLPVSEQFLFHASSVTNLALAIGGGAIAASLLKSPGTGVIFAILVSLSPFYVFVSKTGWGRLTWTPLLILLLFSLQAKAMRQRTFGWCAGFTVLAGFLSLTDGFVILPLLPVFALLITEGDTFRTRLARVIRDRAFLAGFLVFALGVAFGIAIGLAAVRRGTNLTMMAYVLFRGTHGAWIPSWNVLWSLQRHIVFGYDPVWYVNWYFPFWAAWIIVFVGVVLAAIEGVRGRVAGLLAAWWLLAALAVLRYAAGLEASGVSAAPGATSAYNLMVPSLLLFAWLVAAVADGTLPVIRRVPSFLRGAVAISVLAVTSALAVQDARAVAFRRDDLSLSPAGLSNCRVVKAAAAYIRSQPPRLPYVFHLSSDGYLGHFGEFYYGLSYGRSSTPEDPNHLLDFGFWQFNRLSPPQAFYRAYGVERFDYYVDFLDNQEPLRREVADQLVRDGARVVCTITDNGRPIGRILSFSDRKPIELDYRTAARMWDDLVSARTLVRQPLAGTAYHFGYNWRAPE